MQTVDELHHLVHSLTAWEKRAFTTHARRNGKTPQYLRLFHTLDKLEAYDATLVRRAFRGTTAEKNLNELRYALLEELVASIDRRQTGALDLPTRLMHEVDAIEFLAQRNCFATAERRLRKARATAQVHELPSVLLALCTMQRSTMPQTETSLDMLIEDEQYALTIAIDHHESARVLHAWTLRATSMDRFVKGQERGKGGLVEAAPCPQPPTKHPTSALGSLRRLHACLLHASCMRDTTGFVEHATSLAWMLREHAAALQAYPTDVRNAIVDARDEGLLIGVGDVVDAIDLPEPTYDHVLTGTSANVATVPHHQAAAAMRLAIAALKRYDIVSATRHANSVLHDGMLSQAHEGWTSQAMLIAAMAHKLDGNDKLLSHLVRSALRTEERRARFTTDEIAFLRSVLKARQFEVAQGQTLLVHVQEVLAKALLKPVRPRPLRRVKGNGLRAGRS